MARIRSVKPEFFTSEDIVSLTPLARLFYVSLWCEADREGRLSWSTRTLKLRYFPADDCDIEDLADELLRLDLIHLYEFQGKMYCWIPSFKRHQVINNREAESALPDPNDPRVKDASPRVSGEGRKEGREGKGKERKEGRVDAPPRKRGTRLPSDWTLPDDLRNWAKTERPELDPSLEEAKFRDYWTAKAGKDGVKTDWAATWRNWIRNANARASPNRQSTKQDLRADFWRQMNNGRNSETERIITGEAERVD